MLEAHVQFQAIVQLVNVKTEHVQVIDFFKFIPIKLLLIILLK